MSTAQTARPSGAGERADDCLNCRQRLYKNLGSGYKLGRWFHGWSGLEACQCEPLGCPGAGSHNHIGLEVSNA